MTNIFGPVNRPIFFGGKKIAEIQNASMKSEAHDPVIVGRRLEAIRLAKDLGSQPEVADRMGIDKNRYNNWVRGVALIPVAYAAKLREISGASLDYIYLGDLSALSSKLAVSLEEAEAELTQVAEK